MYYLSICSNSFDFPSHVLYQAQIHFPNGSDFQTQSKITVKISALHSENKKIIIDTWILFYMDYLNLVELIARISSILLSLLALIMIYRILRRIFSSHGKSSSNFSVPYLIYFICWILEIITVIPFSVIVLAEWKPTGGVLFMPAKSLTVSN